MPCMYIVKSLFDLELVKSLPWSLLQNMQIISKAARDIILHQYVHPIEHDFFLSSLSKIHLHFSSNIWRALGLHKADFLIPTEI